MINSGKFTSEQTATPADATTPTETADRYVTETAAESNIIAQLPEAQTIDQAIARLAAMSSIEYETVRQSEAKTLNIRVGLLDDAVRKLRRGANGRDSLQGKPLNFDEPEPWPESVDGAQLMADITLHFARHLSTAHADAPVVLALWVAHTYLIGSFQITPRLAITSPEKGCGKTTCLDLVEMVVRSPLLTANATAASIFRLIDADRPTLLIDEADTFLIGNDELQGILNAGHRRGGSVLRVVGDDHQTRRFDVFAPLAIAAIGELPNTTADRSIPISMRRVSPGERPAPISRATREGAAVITRKLRRWAQDVERQIVDPDPAMPEHLVNREADNWRPLFTIAEVVGGDYLSQLSRISGELRETEERNGSAVMLLDDIREIFLAYKQPGSNGAPIRLPTTIILAHLNGREDRPWGEISSKGSKLTAIGLSNRLRPFQVQTVQYRATPEEQKIAGEREIKHDIRYWGYREADFADAFSRYLPPPTPLSKSL
jgi:putative DNA primase/helicase